ncbi:hypothetical protein BYT27DRAFT_7170685 [Phlegmacium glaucopus]|nr:hypothetical protein BYT27DRAFT_7170685 [Phlegmacium glaucopus]
MSNPKERHYWAQLRAALTAGHWRSNSPAKTPKGVSLSWSELFRKFNKHCRGAQDVALVASHTHTLALLISDDSSDYDSLGIDTECLVSEGKAERVKAGYEQLKSLQSSNLDTIQFALAYYAYASGNPALCIAHLENVPELNQVRSHIPTSLSASLSSANLLSPSTYAPSTASSFSPSFTSVVDSTVPEVRDGRGLAMAESFRSICLQGMALEHLHPTTPSIALKTYRSVFPHLFPFLKSQFTRESLLPYHNHNPNHKSSSPSGKPDFTTFHQLRELWRWVERIIWRAVVLCARVCDVRNGWKGGDEEIENEHGNEIEGDSLWTWLSHYTYYSAYWPPAFRTSHRSTISSIHIRALILVHRPSPSLSLPTPTPASPSPSLSPSPRTFKKMPPAWLHRAHLVIQNYKAILSISTTFPRAGTRNEKVEEFVDLCVAVWESSVFGGGGGGGGAGQVGWVIDILWWAIRLTFNSSRILRHMSRLLYLSGDTKLAKRTLKLYIQVVGKAYETSGNVSVANLGSGGEGAGGEEGAGEDIDTDSNWVDTLIFGAIMLFKSSFSLPSPSPSPTSSYLNEMDDLNEAHQIIEKAKTRLNKEDKRLVAKVCLAEGVYWMIVGVKGQDPLTRPTHLSLSHSLLLQSVQTDPTSSGYYHLALSYAIPGGTAAAQESTSTSSNANNANYNLQQAIEYAGLALEADPGDVGYWHLLGLLLTAQERWEQAREVLERGADLGINDDDDVADEGEVGDESVGKGLLMGSEDGDKDSSTIEDKRTVQMDTRTLLGRTPPNPTTNGGTLTIKINGIRNIPPPIVSNNVNNLPPQPTYVFIEPRSPTSSPSLPPASTLLLTPPPSKYPPAPHDLFESHLQLRMTQGALMEIVEGAEGAEELWLEVFGWVAERRSAAAADGGGGAQRRSIDGITQRSSDHISSSQHHTTTTIDASPHHLHPNPNAHHHHQQLQQQQVNYPGAPTNQMYQTQTLAHGSSDLDTNGSITDSLPPPILIPITISPASPIDGEKGGDDGGFLKILEEREKGMDKEKGREKEKDQGKEKRTLNNTFRPKRSTSIDDNNNSNRLGLGLDVQKSKKNVSQMLKGSVKKSRAGITAATKKLGHGVVRPRGLRRSTSTPDFHVVFQQQTSYQASSIHSRRRLSFMSAARERTITSPLPTESPLPPPPTTTTQQQPSSSPSPTTTVGHQDLTISLTNENRLLSDLWLMSAATFRRIGKIEQAKGAIQEAEVMDENNPAVWVQFGLYYIATGYYQHAVDTFQKALFIRPDDVAATVHLSRLYLDPDLNTRLHSSNNQSTETQSSSTTTNSSDHPLPNSDIDLAAGMLSYLTKGKGWDVPEAWYYLAKAYGLQGRKEKEKETLRLALELSERRGVRDIGSALGWCYL